MPLEITNPIALALLAFVIFIFYLTRNTRSMASPTRRKLSLLIRALVFLLVATSLIGLGMIDYEESLSVMFLIDVSDSLPRESVEEAINYVNKAVKNMKEGDTAGVIAFGSEAYVEMPPQDKLRLSEILSQPPTYSTNIAQAIRVALASFPPEASKRIVILSDGQETLGRAREEAVLAKSLGVEISALPMSFQLDQEALLEEMIAPQVVKVDEPFQVKLVVQSLKNTKGRLKLYRDDLFLGEQEVGLTSGKTVFTIPQTLEEGGFHTFEAQLEADDDTLSENNRAMGFTQVLGEPRILYITGDLNSSPSLADVLQAQDIAFDRRGLSDFPSNIAELQNYDAVILDNVSALNLSNEQMRAIQSYVRDLGGGLLAVGGPNSFGMGAYYRTPLEEALPVDADIRQRMVMPSLAIMLIIDKSGSMSGYGGGVTKLELAKEAAISVVELLEDRDRVGLISFSGNFEWTVPMQPASDRRNIAQEISTLVSGGGTEMYPPMVAAYEKLRNSEAKVKHVIILSDGQSQPGDFEGIVDRMAEDNISVSTVAVGRDADVLLMRSIARWGKGRYYYTEDPYTIPRIFTMEALMASRSLIVEKTFQPKVTTFSQILRGLELGDLPNLRGYVATSPKPTAEVLLISPDDDPILAIWRYGLGKAVAFTSDAQPRWAIEWLNWEDYSKFWSQVVRWGIRQSISGNFMATVRAEQGEGKLTIDAVDDKGEFINFLSTKATVIKPDKKGKTLQIKQTGPGRYEGMFPIEETGIYLINVEGKEGDRSVGARVVGLAIPYPPEYKKFGLNSGLLADITRAAGGQILTSEAKVFSHEGLWGMKRIQPLWPLLISLAIILFIFDVASRRVILPAGYLRYMLMKIVSPFKAKPGEEWEAEVEEHEAGEPALDKLKVVSPDDHSARLYLARRRRMQGKEK